MTNGRYFDLFFFLSPRLMTTMSIAASNLEFRRFSLNAGVSLSEYCSVRLPSRVLPRLHRSYYSLICDMNPNPLENVMSTSTRKRLQP